MALVEIDEGELTKLKVERDTALAHKVLLDKLGTNPKTRRQVLGLIKEINPEVQIPELDATKPLEDRIEALTKLVNEGRSRDEKDKEEAQKKAEMKKADEHFIKGKKLLKASGFTDEGVDQVEKWMAERGLVDYEAGLALWEKENPREEPIMPSNFGKDLGLFTPPEDNPWAAAVRAPNKRAMEHAVRLAQNKEVNRYFQENGTRRRA